LSPQTLALVKRAAEIEGRSVCDFVVTAARQAAQRTFAETQVFHLASRISGRLPRGSAIRRSLRPRCGARARRIAALSPERADEEHSLPPDTKSMRCCAASSAGDQFVMCGKGNNRSV
jgi:hypothetical protein